MRTNDGFELKEGDTCYVGIQDPMGIRKFSPKLRKAYYLDENAQKRGFDFTIPKLNCDTEIEVIAVFKNLPLRSKIC